MYRLTEVSTNHSYSEVRTMECIDFLVARDLQVLPSSTLHFMTWTGVEKGNIWSINCSNAHIEVTAKIMFDKTLILKTVNDNRTTLHFKINTINSVADLQFFATNFNLSVREVLDCLEMLNSERLHRELSEVDGEYPPSTPTTP